MRYVACPGPRCLTRIPDDRELCHYCRRSIVRRAMCLCGVEATIIDGESTLAALDRHYATPEHRAWKARRAA